MLNDFGSSLRRLLDRLADPVLPEACPHCEFPTVVRDDREECPWCGWGPDSIPDRTPEEARQKRLDDR